MLTGTFPHPPTRNEQTPLTESAPLPLKAARNACDASPCEATDPQPLKNLPNKAAQHPAQRPIALNGTPTGHLPDPFAIHAAVADLLSHPIDPADVLACSLAAAYSLPQYRSPAFWNTLPEPDNDCIRARMAPLLVSAPALTPDASLYAVNLASVYRKYCEWTASVPRVRPFYAVKCNPSREVVRTLVACGAGFDCASKAEIELCLEMGASVDDIIFANPCKAPPQLRYAKSVSVRTMTFDNVDELRKIAKMYPTAELVLRLYTEDSHSSCPLGSKFGAHEDAVPELLETLVELNLNMVGVSFHVGSGCYNAEAYVEAIHLARRVFDLAETFGFRMRLLDLGGGYPGCLADDEITFAEIAERINPALDANFGPEVQVISEPGRYFVSAAFTLASPVVRKQEQPITADEEVSNANADGNANTNANTNGDNICDSDSLSSLSTLSSLESAHNTTVTMESQILSHDTSVEFASRHSSFNAGASRPVYYINDSVYGSFKDSILLQIRFKPILHRVVPSNAPLRPSQILGNSGEAHDIVHDNLLLPDLQVGDWMLFPNMGAYTVSLSSSFNGCGSHSFVYYWAS